MTRPFPQYSRNERRADMVVHAAGLLMGAAGALWLLMIGSSGVAAGDALGLTLYAAGLIAMLTLSASYNFSRNPDRKELLRRLDRAAIFIMIAGTYSPFALAKIAGAAGLGLFALVWALALLGIVLALAFPRRSDRVALVMYLAMGWCILLALKPLADAVPIRVVALLVAGGVVYTLGVPLYLAGRLPYHNPLWHACVLAAASCHYLAVLAAFAPIEA